MSAADTNVHVPYAARGSDPGAIPMPLVWRFAASGLISAFAMLLVYPAAVVNLASRGASSMQVGLFAALTPLVMMALIVLLPRLQRHMGRVSLVRIAVVAGAVAIAGFLVTTSYPLWLIFSALVGVQFAIHWTSVDTVLSENVPKERAGAIIGLYQTLLAGAVAAGPGMVALLKLPFQTAALAGLVLMLAAILPTFGEIARRIDGAAKAQGESRTGLLLFWRRNPALIAAAILAGLFEVGTSAMGAVHALHLGFAAAAAVMVASVIATGSLVAQFPLGWLADRYSVERLMRIAGSVLFLASITLPIAAWEPWLLWPLAALWGAFGGGLQTLVYMSVALTKKGAEIGLGMITMALGFTFGSLVGPGVGGLAKQLSPDHGLTLMLSLMAAAVLAVVWGDRGSKRHC